LLRQLNDQDEKEKKLAQAHENMQLNRKIGPKARDMHQQMAIEPTVDIEKIPRWRRTALNMISSWIFDAVIGVVIVANAVTIGVETEHVVGGHEVPPIVRFLEQLFLVVYIVELGLRFYGIGLRVLNSHWVKFDLFLVICGVVDSIVMTIFMAGEDDSSVLDKIMLVRMLRLMRLVRAARLVVQFRALWLLVQGLCLSVLPMLWTLLLLMTLLYVFSVLGMEVIGGHEDNTIDEQTCPNYAVAMANFQNLGDSMMTLLQFVTLDGGYEVYRPLISCRPELAMYFIVFILLGSIALMNLVTAIMVEASLRQAKEDSDAEAAWEALKRKEMAPKLMEMFRALDADESGELELDEILQAPPEIQEQLLRVCCMEDLQETFKMLDYDSSGGVDMEEFCNGIMRVQADKPTELIRIMKQCTDIIARLKSLEIDLEEERKVASSRLKALEDYGPPRGASDET
jgi:hypothetical protein